MKRTDWKQIKHDYETSNTKLKDLARKYHVNVGTLRSHKSRYHWGESKTRNDVAMQQKDNATLHSNVATKVDIRSLQKSGLTPKRQNFCLLYLKYYNATKAYKLAYGCKYSTAHVEGSVLLANPSIQKELTKIRQKQVNNLHVDKSNIIVRLLMMFYADIGDYIHFGHKKRENLDTGERYNQSYVYLKNQDDVDTTPVAEIHIGKDGTEVKLPDKVKVAKELLKYLPDPINRNVQQDTLVSAIKKYIANNSGKSGKN